MQVRRCSLGVSEQVWAIGVLAEIGRDRWLTSMGPALAFIGCSTWLADYQKTQRFYRYNKSGQARPRLAANMSMVEEHHASAKKPELLGQDG